MRRVIILAAVLLSSCTLIESTEVRCALPQGDPINDLSQVRGEWVLSTVIDGAPNIIKCRSAADAGFTLRVFFAADGRFYKWRDGDLTVQSTYEVRDGRLRITDSHFVLSSSLGYLVMSAMHLDGPAYVTSRVEGPRPSKQD
jgi:hypothetical protein